MRGEGLTAAALQTYYNDRMTFTVRLDDETEALLERLAQSEGLSRAEIVRRSIRLLAEQRMTRGETTPFDTLKHLIGRTRGGPPDLSERTGSRFRELLVRKSTRGR
jgi:Arc/MetJ-type ribon-helix-helix transcriptional regulator